MVSGNLIFLNASFVQREQIVKHHYDFDFGVQGAKVTSINLQSRISGNGLTAPYDLFYQDEKEGYSIQFDLTNSGFSSPAFAISPVQVDMTTSTTISNKWSNLILNKNGQYTYNQLYLQGKCRFVIITRINDDWRTNVNWDGIFLNVQVQLEYEKLN